MFRLWMELGLIFGISVTVTFLVLRALLLGLIWGVRRLMQGGIRFLRKRRKKRVSRRIYRPVRPHDWKGSVEVRIPHRESLKTEEEKAEAFVEQVKEILAAEARRDWNRKNWMQRGSGSHFL